MTERLVSDRGAAFRWRWALPLAPIAASMFCLSALVYYHTAMGGTGAAWGFFQGAVVASYRWLGFVPNFMFWLLLFVWCSIWFVTGRWEGARTRLGWMAVFTLCIAILVNLGTPIDPLPPHAGVVGTFVAVRLTSVIGYAFGALLAVAAALASLLLATDFLFYRYFEALARGRVADDVGVEPEATDAFRELAFVGVYADDAQAARATDGGAAADDFASEVDEPAPDDAAALLDATDDVDADAGIVVRPRWSRRDRRTAAASGPIPAMQDIEQADPAQHEAEAAEVVETDEGAHDLAGAGSTRDVMGEPTAEEFDLSEAAGSAPSADEEIDSDSDDEGVDHERPVVLAAAPVDDAAESEDPIEDADEEPVVEIPRVDHRRQRQLFTPAPGVVDRAAREVLEAGRASVTVLRRRLRCSAGEALELLDKLRAAGVIDGEPGSPNGHVLTTLADWEAR